MRSYDVELLREVPFPAALFLLVLVADLVQYWTHRAYHEVPWLCGCMRFTTA